jgi:hypothetical protein
LLLLEGEEPGLGPLVGDGAQMQLFGAAAGPEALLEELAELDADALTPLEALQRLYELRRRARERLAMEG